MNKFDPMKPGESNPAATGPLRRFLTSIGLLSSKTEAAAASEMMLQVAADADPAKRLALILTTLTAQLLPGRAFADVRLSELVIGCLDMDQGDALLLGILSGRADFRRTKEDYAIALDAAIRELKLQPLFWRSKEADDHRTVFPGAYNDLSGEVYPAEMARWRSDFRNMKPEQQMVTATIVWLYQGGNDSVWLRRVPCTWLANEALNYLADSAYLTPWLRLVVTFPGI